MASTGSDERIIRHSSFRDTSESDDRGPQDDSYTTYLTVTYRYTTEATILGVEMRNGLGW
jgi:hypothetical protein